MVAIKARREQMGFTQLQLAKISGVKQSVICDIENGHTPFPRVDTVMKLAKVFGCTVEELMEERKQ